MFDLTSWVALQSNSVSKKTGLCVYNGLLVYNFFTYRNYSHCDLQAQLRFCRQVTIISEKTYLVEAGECPNHFTIQHLIQAYAASQLLWIHHLHLLPSFQVHHALFLSSVTASCIRHRAFNHIVYELRQQYWVSKCVPSSGRRLCPL